MLSMLWGFGDELVVIVTCLDVVAGEAALGWLSSIVDREVRVGAGLRPS